MLSFHVKFVQTDMRKDGRTYGQTDNGKTKCPRSFDTGAYKCQKVLQMDGKHCEKRGEIAHIEQFLLFPQCFQKTCTVDT